MTDHGDPAAAFDVDDSIAGRILRVAREQFFSGGYSSVTMDVLAHELGMSKKTLYAHFPSKDAIFVALTDVLGRTIRRQVETVLDKAELDFAGKLQAVMAIVGAHLGRATPAFLRDLQRHAPDLYEKIDDLRGRNIPAVFGRMLRAGIKDGVIRDDVSPEFAAEFWLQAVNGLTHPATLQRTGLSPRETLERAIRLFLRGVATEAGRKSLGLTGAAARGRRGRGRAS
jgi:AcrR family transcriptional regulator